DLLHSPGKQEVAWTHHVPGRRDLLQNSVLIHDRAVLVRRVARAEDQWRALVGVHGAPDADLRRERQIHAGGAVSLRSWGRGYSDQPLLDRDLNLPVGENHYFTTRSAGTHKRQ